MYDTMSSGGAAVKWIIQHALMTIIQLCYIIKSWFHQLKRDGGEKYVASSEQTDQDVSGKMYR